MNAIFSKLTNVSFVVASAVVFLAMYALVVRDTFGIGKLVAPRS